MQQQRAEVSSHAGRNTEIAEMRQSARSGAEGAEILGGERESTCAERGNKGSEETSQRAENSHSKKKNSKAAASNCAWNRQRRWETPSQRAWHLKNKEPAKQYQMKRWKKERKYKKVTMTLNLFFNLRFLCVRAIPAFVPAACCKFQSQVNLAHQQRQRRMSWLHGGRKQFSSKLVLDGTMGRAALLGEAKR